MGTDYLARRSARLALEALKKEIVFGMVISSMLLAVGTWHRYLVVGANDPLWATVAVVGVLGWCVTLVLPSLWKGPEYALGLAMRKLGAWLFAVVLTALYVAFVVPVGWLLRRTSGTGPIVAWDNPEAIPRGEGWRAKEVTFEARIGGRGKPNLARRFLAVLQFFARRGHWLFLPLLVVLLALGIVLFFVKSSALAPFIYTLF